MKLYKTILSIGMLAIMAAAGCDRLNEGEEQAKEADMIDVTALDAKLYALKSEKVRQFVGSSQIARRGDTYQFSRTSIAKPLFAQYQRSDLEYRLEEVSGAVLGMRADESTMVDMGNTIGFQTDGGFAWVAQDTGAFTAKRIDTGDGVSVIEGAEDAVNRALTHIVDSKLLSLNENVSLDVVSVNATVNSGWREENGQTVPVYFEDRQGELVEEYTSEYTVYFGRRYRGIPILGPTLMVRMDHDGRLAALSKNWRDITGEEGEVDILSQEEAKASTHKSMEKAVSAICGYVEQPAVDYTQRNPGIGCEYWLHNGQTSDPMNSLVSHRVDFSADPSLTLLGEGRNLTE